MLLFSFFIIKRLLIKILTKTKTTKVGNNIPKALPVTIFDKLNKIIDERKITEFKLTKLLILPYLIEIINADIKETVQVKKLMFVNNKYFYRPITHWKPT